jgi:curved DNA-binding protein CbpA
MASDHYRVLGIPRHATTPEIRRAYRRLARQQHPDHNPQPDGAERFRALAEAYAVLNDPARRARYDHAYRPVKPRPIPPTRPAHAPVRGVLELSPYEAQLAATGRLTFTTPQGVVIALPTGVRDGDQVTWHVGSGTVVLTVRVLPDKRLDIK